MGTMLWIACGLLAAIVGQILRFARLHWLIELGLTVSVAFIGGLTATALDFGGWKEADPRAGIFAFLLSFAALGCARAIRQVSLRRRAI